MRGLQSFFFFFFNDTATTEIYTLSLHDALPIFESGPNQTLGFFGGSQQSPGVANFPPFRYSLWPVFSLGPDRKSTRLNSSHGYISYAVFCLKKKKNHIHCFTPLAIRLLTLPRTL